MRVLVTGAGGQLGRELLVRLGPRGVGRTHAELDLTDPSAIEAALDELSPDAVVNAAAYTAVDRAETEPDAAFAANHDGPQALAALCFIRDLRLVHLSTDYVFDGTKGAPYVETDPVTPASVYGASKAAGEAAVLSAHPGALVVRTSWLFSAHGTNFVTTLLRLTRERPALRVVADQTGCPTFAGDLARGLLFLLEQGAGGGLYHLAGAGPATWHDLATAVVEEAAHLDLAPRVPVEPIPTSAYPTPARRPAYSVLATGKARALGLVPAPWLDGVRAVLAELAARAERP